MNLCELNLMLAIVPESPGTSAVAKLASKLRGEFEYCQALERASRSLAETCRRISSGSDPIARWMVKKIAQQRGWSELLVRASLDQLVIPFVSEETLLGFARRTEVQPQLLGFVMAGNIPGAGLLEVIAALLTGSVAMIKAATSEPIFFRGFAEVLAQVDPALASRLVVLLWSRERIDLSTAMRAHCDRILVFGADETVASFESGVAPVKGGVTGFGARVSGAVLTNISGASQAALARMMAMDVTLFEQQGCLSPHHIFVGDSDGTVAQDFAAELASQLEILATDHLPIPRRLPPESAVAIRHAREQARWRALGGDAVRLWEGPLPGWTVIYDRDATFQQSPGYRTAFVSPFVDGDDLARRLAQVHGKIEACAFFVDDPASQLATNLRRIIEAAGASYICAPGEMQSPPLDWPHGGGIFRTLHSSPP